MSIFLQTGATRTARSTKRWTQIRRLFTEAVPADKFWQLNLGPLPGRLDTSSALPCGNASQNWPFVSAMPQSKIGAQGLDQ